MKSYHPMCRCQILPVSTKKKPATPQPEDASLMVVLYPKETRVTFNPEIVARSRWRSLIGVKDESELGMVVDG